MTLTAFQSADPRQSVKVKILSDTCVSGLDVFKGETHVISLSDYLTLKQYGKCELVEDAAPAPAAPEAPAPAGQSETEAQKGKRK